MALFIAISSIKNNYLVIKDRIYISDLHETLQSQPIIVIKIRFFLYGNSVNIGS